MQSQFGFTLYTIGEFEQWIAGRSVARTIRFVQEHHTWRPSYQNFGGSNHFALQRGMKNHHVGVNGWSDIGQHFTTFPDGTIMTGRSIDSTPACIYENNARAVCIENLGDFDTGRDTLTAAHHATIIRATAALLKRFGLGAPNTTNIVYHHWFDLNTGARTNGGGNTKTCPGTGFFGGNSLAACQANFLPLVASALGGGSPGPSTAVINKYVCVDVDTLTVRIGPGASHAKAPDQDPAPIGSILRVYGTSGTWLKISNSKQRWVNGSRTYDVHRAVVNTADSKCRSGAGTAFPIVTALNLGDEVFVHAVDGNWSRIAMDDRWMSNILLDLT